ncbi:50S ribosomal protein L18 [Rudaea sp.]|uniref:50S ribosomal protein L18 n=1 Tax=Rudaea sp. TaxID=2136325 RepID=UPI002ED1F9BC
MSNEKNESRLRRAKSTRMHIKKLAVPRLTVHRSDQHIYAQVISADGGKVIAAASTVQKAIKGEVKGTKNKTAAAAVGKAIAEKAKAAGIESVAFDRSGFRYHGRIAALADAAREAGLKF